MSGGLRAAKRASMPSGYGSRLISLTLIDGNARPNAARVARSDASSTGDELQCARVIVVFCCTLGAVARPVVADEPPAVTPAARTTSAMTVRNETRAPLTTASLVATSFFGSAMY